MTSDWAVLHEYGHHLESTISTLAVTPPNYHDGCAASFVWSGGLLINTAEHAWVEAFASHFANAVGRTRVPDGAIPDGAQFGGRIETPANCGVVGMMSTAGPVTPAMVENLVEASLWDLVDPVGHPAQGVEAHDRVADEDMTIFQIFDRELDNGIGPTILRFRSAWIARGKDATGLDCILANHGILTPTPGCRQSTAVKLAGDFDGDGYTDIALTGARGWGSIPVAFSNGNGTFRVTNNGVAEFPTWAANPRAAKLVGDFNGDGRADIALAGGVGWGSIPVAFSDGTGGFQIFNNPSAEFATLAADPEAQKLTGDFNNDGRTDIALIGPVGWQSIPIAFSIGNGEFLVTNQPVLLTNFMARASHLRATRLAGHFNSDRRTDILIAGLPGAAALPIALASGNGTFAAGFIQSSDFAAWASDPRSTKLTGDFNGDGITDVALTSTPGWSSVPMALSNGAGGWAISNEFIGEYAAWAATPRVTPLLGDFDGGGYADIALTGASGWNTVPVASSTAWDFLVDNAWVGDFGGWSATPGAVPLVGDFNGDGRRDIALTGAAGWGSVPVAFSNGFSVHYIGQRPPGFTPGLTFTVTNFAIAEFAAWAAAP
jgi:hypothetical protein